MPYLYRVADNPNISKARIFPEVRMLKTSDFTPLTKKNLKLINNAHMRHIIAAYPSRIEVGMTACLPKQALFRSLNSINDRSNARFLDDSKPCTFRHAAFVLKNFLNQEPAGSLMIMPGIMTRNNEVHPGSKLCLFMARMKETARSNGREVTSVSKKLFMAPISVELPSLFIVDQVLWAWTMMFVPKLFRTGTGTKKEEMMCMLPVIL